MEDRRNNPYLFIVSLIVIASFILSLAHTQLKSLQDYNIEVDRKKNLLKAIGINVKPLLSEEIVDIYNDKVSEVIITTNGNVIDDLSLSDLSIKELPNGKLVYSNNSEEYLPLFKSMEPEAYILPVTGKGLWSTLMGYLAVESDFNTVKGITFYKHAETAGLGGEIEKEWFQNNFVGKKIKNSLGEFVGITVLKGRAEEKQINSVDGISGATITSKGVTDLLKRDIYRFVPFFQKEMDRIR